MAIGWCQATGVYAKMMGDVAYISKSKGRPNLIYPRQSKIRSEEALTIGHLIPPYIILASGLVLSVITFCVEKCSRKSRRAKRGPLNQYRWAIPRVRRQDGDGGRRPGRGEEGGRRPNRRQASGNPNAGQGK